MGANLYLKCHENREDFAHYQKFQELKTVTSILKVKSKGSVITDILYYIIGSLVLI